MNWKLIRVIDVLVGIPLIRLITLPGSKPRNARNRGTAAAPHNILLIKFWGIGNIFMLIPSIQALRNRYPGSRIDFLTLESNREALSTLGLVNSIITIDTGSVFRFIRTWRSSATALTASGYDLAIDFEQFARFSALMTFQSGAQRTIGFATRGQHRHHLYTTPIEYNNNKHIRISFLDLAAAAGAESPSADTPSFSTSHLLNRSDVLLRHGYGITGDTPLIVMHIGTSDNFCERRWPTRSFAALADMLFSRFTISLVMTGLPEEAFLVHDAVKIMANASRVIDLGGRLTFIEYCSLIAAADLVISADTAAVHIASAFDTPVVGLYGPNTPLLYGPWGRNSRALYASFPCSPCITNFNSKIATCRHPDGRGACMSALDAGAVLDAIESTFSLPDSRRHIQKMHSSHGQPA